MKFSDIPQFITSNYFITMPWRYINNWIKEHGDLINLNPEFQRSHVWTKEQQSRYIEYILQNGLTGRDIYWNCSSWMKGFNTPLVLVDGKQRLKAVRKFMRNKVIVFNKYYYEDFEGKLDITVHNFTFHVNNLQKESDVLLWYLQFNSYGTIHTNEEINKVKKMYEETLQKEK